MDGAEEGEERKEERRKEGKEGRVEGEERLSLSFRLVAYADECAQREVKLSCAAFSTMAMEEVTQ